MPNDADVLSLLLFHTHASDRELSRAGVTREEVLNLALTFEAEIDVTQRDRMADHAKALLMAYKVGQRKGMNIMSNPPDPTRHP